MGNIIHHRLKSFTKNKRLTFLGVGPMSVNCVDATIELSNEYCVPIFLIASRRQIDSEEFGCGYVNNWSTKEYSKYVIEKDKKGKILLARDHGGPWQHPNEIQHNLSLREAMESAKKSYLADIEAGFQVLHIDPSIDIHGSPNVDEILNRVFELYEYCWTQSQILDREIIFEIGTEEQSGSTNSLEYLNYTLNAINSFCSTNKLPKPTFVVIQCGTRVMEMRNVGSFDSPVRVANELPAEIQLPKMIEICDKHGILMKEHNTDYLSDEALQWHPRLSIHAANVAPEFGVAETKALIRILEDNNLSSLSERFQKISYESKKWTKWMLQDSITSDYEKALIAGHYVFSDLEVKELKNEAAIHLEKKGIILDEYLKQSVKISILRYLRNFRLI